jgi:hypothetical protein
MQKNEGDYGQQENQIAEKLNLFFAALGKTVVQTI